MSFTVAIVGRPNVGKSTLFNRLVGKRLALVDDLPGVTRDRREGHARLGDLEFTAIDTAGLESAAPASLAGRMVEQTRAAIAHADAVIFLIDGRAGLVPDDRVFADLIRKSGKPAIVAANKSEGKAGEAGRLEAYALGFGDPLAISAEHGEGLSDLYDALRDALPEATAEPATQETADDEPARPIRVAVIGRPNAGKSTLINRLLGQERLLTGPEAGITRDSIAVDLEWHGQAFRLYDTAGIRRRPKVQEKLEKLSVADALHAIRFADVVVLLMDTDRAFEEQDLRLAALVEREGRALVIGMSKWDLAEHKAGAFAKLRAQADHWLPQLKGVPVIGVSGLTGEGLDRLMEAVLAIHAVWNTRVSTASLNRGFEAIVAAHPPPAVSGRRLKLNYLTQAKSRPPTFVLFCTRADALPDDYQRYLVNGLREAFELPGTPIRLTLREKANPFAGRANTGLSRAGDRINQFINWIGTFAAPGGKLASENHEEAGLTQESLMMRIAVVGVLSVLALATAAPAFAGNDRGTTCKHCPKPRPLVRYAGGRADHPRHRSFAGHQHPDRRSGVAQGAHQQPSRDPQEHHPPRRRDPPQPHDHREGNPLPAPRPGAHDGGELRHPEIPHRAPAGDGRL